MEEAYSNLNNAYLQIKGMIVVEGFYALVAGFVITTFVFKLAGIIKEMVHEGKGFNAKQFYELGREYILCIALICIMPVLLDTLETVLAYAADRLMESLAAGGVYNPDNIWTNTTGFPVFNKALNSSFWLSGKLISARLQASPDQLFGSPITAMIRSASFTCSTASFTKRVFSTGSTFKPLAFANIGSFVKLHPLAKITPIIIIPEMV